MNFFLGGKYTKMYIYKLCLVKDKLCTGQEKRETMQKASKQAKNSAYTALDAL